MKKVSLILAILFALIFILNLMWLFTGSLEQFPTAEQEEKVSIVAILGMFVSFVPFAICLTVFMKTKK